MRLLSYKGENRGIICRTERISGKGEPTLKGQKGFPIWEIQAHQSCHNIGRVLTEQAMKEDNQRNHSRRLPLGEIPSKSFTQRL